LRLLASALLTAVALSLAAASAQVSPEAAPARDASARLGDLVIEQPWSRATPAGSRVASGYLRIINSGQNPDRLLGGRTPRAGRVEIHRMEMQGEIMTMRPVAGGLEIRPGDSLTLEPGGFHLMLADLATPLSEGETIPVTLRFEKAGEATLDFVVRGVGARAAGGHTHNRQ
jgi:copper(I)-binding protein